MILVSFHLCINMVFECFFLLPWGSKRGIGSRFWMFFITSNVKLKVNMQI